MICPLCRKGNTCVVETRESENSTRRRRECFRCRRRFTTYERFDDPTLAVIKKDGQIERYSRKKVMDGVLTACEKRQINTEKIEKLVNDVERELLASRRKKVSSEEIGRIVLKHLKRLDQVAYVRFASVCLNFSDLETFRNEIDGLLKVEKKKR